jgi:hypothetical protein
LSGGFEAYSADEGIQIIEHALVEAIEPRSLLLVEAGIRSYQAEKARGKGRIENFAEQRHPHLDHAALLDNDMQVNPSNGDNDALPHRSSVVN